MRVLVCGGRDFTHKEFLFETLNLLHKRYNFELLIEGEARGADRMAVSWAVLNKIPIMGIPADWKIHGKSAGPIRNKQMLEEGRPQLVVAFAGGSGTRNMIYIARKRLVNVLHFL